MVVWNLESSQKQDFPWRQLCSVKYSVIFDRPAGSLLYWFTPFFCHNGALWFKFFPWQDDFAFLAGLSVWTLHWWKTWIVGEKKYLQVSWYENMTWIYRNQNSEAFLNAGNHESLAITRFAPWSRSFHFLCRAPLQRRAKLKNICLSWLIDIRNLEWPQHPEGTSILE